MCCYSILKSCMEYGHKQVWWFWFVCLFSKNAANADSCTCGVLCMFRVADEGMII